MVVKFYYIFFFFEVNPFKKSEVLCSKYAVENFQYFDNIFQNSDISMLMKEFMESLNKFEIVSNPKLTEEK